jgi:hypothetical protein
VNLLRRRSGREGAGRIGLAMAAAGFRAKGVENCAIGCAALPEGVI